MMIQIDSGKWISFEDLKHAAVARLPDPDGGGWYCQFEIDKIGLITAMKFSTKQEADNWLYDLMVCANTPEWKKRETAVTEKDHIFTCSECYENRIQRWHTFCINCGRKIKWLKNDQSSNN